MYYGAQNNDIILPSTPNIGSSGNVVIRLSQTVPNFVNHIMYFDNFYFSLPLIVYLRARGIFTLGNIKSNRIPNDKLPKENVKKFQKTRTRLFSEIY